MILQFVALFSSVRNSMSGNVRVSDKDSKDRIFSGSFMGFFLTNKTKYVWLDTVQVILQVTLNPDAPPDLSRAYESTVCIAFA